MGNIEKLTGLESSLEVGKKINEVIDTSKSMMTNCLLEVPQRIKYELVNGTLTIKAGTVVIVPYGTEAPTFNIGDAFINDNFKVVDVQYENSQLFYWVEVQNDVNYFENAIDNNTNSRVCCLNITNNSIGIYIKYSSGTSETYETGYNEIRYRTDLIKMQFYSGTDGLTDFVYSLPLGVVKADGTYTAGSVTQIFNGMGYIGSSFWLDKGVKGLMPDGRNEDGSLKNVAYETKKMYMQQYTTDYEAIDFSFHHDGVLAHNFLIESEEISPIQTHKTYVPSKNIIYWRDGTAHKEFYIGKGTIKDGVIAEFITYRTFQPASINDVEGRWINASATLEEDFKITNTDVTYYDLSKILPDNLNVYEVMIEVNCKTGTTTAHNFATYVESDIMPSTCAGAVTNTVGVQSISANTLIFPVRGRIGISSPLYAEGDLRSIFIKGYKRSK